MKTFSVGFSGFHKPGVKILFSAIKRKKKKKKALEEQAHGENKKIEFSTNTGYVISPLSTDTPSIRTSLLKCSQFTINLPASVNIR